MDSGTVSTLVVDNDPNLFATCGKEKRDTEQRSEWTFHRGIPIEVVNV